MGRRSGLASALILAAAFVLSACQIASSPEQVAGRIRLILQAPPASVTDPDVWSDVQDVYSRREARPLWIADGQTKARKAMVILQTATDHGLTVEAYGASAISADLDRIEVESGAGDERTDELARLDVKITTALLDLGRDVAFGRLSPKQLNRTWRARREGPDLVASLIHASENDLPGWLDAVRPQHKEYAWLQAELRRLRIQFPPAVSGQGKPAAPSNRSEIIALNLERWRWMPDQLGDAHVLVNIPAYRLTVREGDRTALTMPVVVGDPAHQTPVFSGEMDSVVFSPYWNIPDSIVEGEIGVAAARDPGYLKRSGIDILRVSHGGTEDVSPDSVNWEDPEGLKELAFRQRPGTNNALGHVKFLFPNPYSVYLHDTPADALFARDNRALSHGCIRLSQPDELSAFVLRHNREWDIDRRRAAMNSGDEQHVALSEKLPVHIVYMTAWADDSGRIQFAKDIYGLDAAQAKLTAH
jgi:murein L,D-transpeptidase YcbB/YkuD